MVTILQQLRADFEASTPPPWEVNIQSQRAAEVIAPCPCCGLVAKRVFPWDATAIITAHNRMSMVLDALDATAKVVRQMTPIEHPLSPTDYAHGKVTNEEWRAMVESIAMLLKEAK